MNGNKPLRGFRQPERRVRRGDGEITGHDDAEPARMRVAVDGRDERLTERCHGSVHAQQRSSVRLAAGRARAGSLIIAAEAEDVAGAREHAGVQRVVAASSFERLRDLAGERRREAVAGFRPVQRQHGDVFAARDEQVGHRQGANCFSRLTISSRPMKSLNSAKGVSLSAIAFVEQPSRMKVSIMSLTALCIASIGSTGQIA